MGARGFDLSLLCIIGFVLGLDQTSLASIGTYPIQNFSPANYQAGIQNIDFAQNRDMQIFVANNLGVLSYNGNEWGVHAFKTGKKHRSLAFDESTDRLYVGSQGDFGYFQGLWEYRSLAELIPGDAENFDDVWDIFIVKDKVYFCTLQNIYLYEGDEIHVLSLQNGLRRSFMCNGRLFSESAHGDIYEVVDHRFELFTNRKASNQVVAGMAYVDDEYLIVYNSGSITFSPHFSPHPKYVNLVAVLEGTYVNHVLQLSDSRLVVSTQRQGIFLYDPSSELLEQITKSDGLQSNACLRTYQDFSGNLWVGQQSGISLILINSPMRMLSHELALEGSGYEVIEAAEGTYYTTSNGIYFAPRLSQRVNFISGTEGPAYGFSVINDNLYAGHHNGLYRLFDGKAELMANTSGIWKIKWLRAHPDYAIGGGYEGFDLFTFDRGKRLKLVGRINGFDESSRFFEEDKDGDIIVSQYYKGIYRLKFSEDLKDVSVHPLPDSVGNLPLHQVILGKIDNEICLGTSNGLYTISGPKDVVVEMPPLSNLIGRQPVYLIRQDRQKNIYVIAENIVGFFRQISTNNYSFVPSSLHQLRYNLNTDFLNASAGAENGIFFSANQGFIQYFPEMEDRASIDRPLLICKIRNINQDLDPYEKLPFSSKPIDLEDIDLGRHAKALAIHIESFQFINKNNQRFRYFLEGFDEDYSEWTASTTKEYTNLDEGTYTFQAQTQNYLGEVHSSLPLDIIVRPPLHRSMVARFLYLLLSIVALILFYRMQKKSFEKRTKELEERQLAEISTEREKLERIARQKEDELIQLEEEKMANELRHLNNLLAASTMNLVVKNEFIETIKEGLKEIRSKGKELETKKALERLEREIDSALRLQEDWQQFEYHFDKVHGDFQTRIRDEFEDLTPNDQKLCAFLRLNLSTKEIANLMSISLRGAEIARYRLRMKLNLKKGENLSKFILNY